MTRRWVVACVLAETVGMAASAGAARGATQLALLPGFLLVVGGGLVEGTALGLFQGRALAERLGGSGRRAWLTVTLLVAGLGWAAGSAPATLAGDEGGSQPPLALMLLGAAGIGLVMGALLGATQAWVLARRAARPARHPWRWVLGSSLSWTVAMVVIFAGATTAGSGWPWLVVVGYGALTGAVAGLALGLVGAPFLETLDGPPVQHRLVVAWLRRRRTPAGDGLSVLEVRGIRTGRSYRFPVQAAIRRDSEGPDLVVCPGHATRKTWWRNLDAPDSGPAPLAVLDHGAWVAAEGRVLRERDPGWESALAAYSTRFPRVPVDGPLVVVTLGTKVPAT